VNVKLSAVKKTAKTPVKKMVNNPVNKTGSSPVKKAEKLVVNLRAEAKAVSQPKN